MIASANRAPRIAVVIPAYNHGAYIGEAIASVLEQGCPDMELRILDDGSTDDTLAMAERALQDAAGGDWRLDTQANAGSARTLNRLIERTDADLVAILNSDDLYLPGRLKLVARHWKGKADFLAFSGVTFGADALVNGTDTFEDWYRGKLAYAMSLPTCGFALVTANLAISTSNFIFSRQLFDRVGGFNPALPLTQDWEFLLKALRHAEPQFVPQRLLHYRIHATNTFRNLMDVRIDQSRQALAAYAGWADQAAVNPLAPTPRAWPRFFQVFARSCAPAFSVEPVGEFLPPALLQDSEGSGHRAALEDEALRNLLQAARRRADNLRRGTDNLLSDAAALWDGFRARIEAHA